MFRMNTIFKLKEKNFGHIFFLIASIIIYIIFMMFSCLKWNSFNF